MPFGVVTPHSQAEVFVRNCMTEDENLGEPSYVDFLCALHRDVQLKMDH